MTARVLLNILSFSLIWESRLSFMASLGHYSYSSVSCFTPLLISALSCLLVSTPASAEWYMVASRATPRIGAWLWRAAAGNMVTTMTHATDFPLYTARHSQHSAVWTVPGFSIHRFCIACATERLENADELGVHVKKVLKEFQTLLSATNEKGAFVKTITSNARIIEHLSNVLFGQWTVYKFSYFSCLQLSHNAACLPSLYVRTTFQTWFKCCSSYRTRLVAVVLFCACGGHMEVLGYNSAAEHVFHNRFYQNSW